MKAKRSPLKRFPGLLSDREQSKGFALIATISILVLLALISVGLLSLSSVTVRSSTSSKNQEIARANAKLGLMLAIGELQRLTGPDQRITARANVLKEDIRNPQLTGVWESWEINANQPPAASDYDRSTKDNKFLGWLVSSENSNGSTNVSLADQALSNPVVLIGEGTLGNNPPPEDIVEASKIPVITGNGSCAWVVLDEGTKARINTPYINNADSVADKIAQLGSGVRPATERMTGIESLDREHFEKGSVGFSQVEKGISRENYSLAVENLATNSQDAALADLFHDVTIHSQGLLTNTARGGLKQDFDLLSNLENLPARYSSQGVYSSLLELDQADAPSDPQWETLHEFSRIYRDGTLEESEGLPLVQAQSPSSWNVVSQERVRGGRTVDIVDPSPPPGVVLMPNIAKVQMIFSLIGRDLYRQSYYAPGPAPRLNTTEKARNMHGPQDGHFRNTKYDYDLHLLYTPVITLHNPYNVMLEFRDLNVSFKNIPFAMQLFRNGEAQSTGLVPFVTMYADNDRGNKDKTFGLNLKTERRGGPGESVFRMLPGETKLFSPYIDPSLTWSSNFSGGRKFWDIYAGNQSSIATSDVDAIPGWRGDGIGWDCDWLAGSKRVDGVATNGRWESCLGLAVDDQIHVEFAPLGAPSLGNKFTITMSARTPNSGRSATFASAIEIDFEDETGLQDTILGEGKTLRFPSTGTVMGEDLVDHSSRQIKDIVNAKPFAMLSVQAKTTQGGVDQSGLDGRLATKPWSFAHASIAGSMQKVLSEHPAQHSHEMELQVLDLGEGTTQAIGIDSQQRGNFITGHSTDKGSKFGAMYEIPLGPIQTLAGLNGANPGGLSGYLPRFAQPIGNSWAHPYLSSSSIVTNGLLDHSFLLNLALYDDFYFSGLADQGGPFGSGETSTTLGSAYASGQDLADPRMVFHNSSQSSASEFNAVIDDPEGYTQIAAWQMMQGAFNINSTSVPAWKSMLASVHDLSTIANLVNPTSTTTRLEELEPAADTDSRISRFKLPLSDTIEASNEFDRLRYWLGPRDYTDEELTLLAEKIVEQVRERGPFLSMAEFVNRQLGNGENAQRGALQEAIDNADLNSELAGSTGAGFEITSEQIEDYNYANPEAGTGPSYQGAPGFLSQADILSVLGNAATPRSDTFTIRAYGEALDQNNKVLATATCEAVVQRMPEWVEAQDLVETPQDSLTSEANQTFGRRFQVVSFKWLSKGEI